MLKTMFTVTQIKLLIQNNNIAAFYNDRTWRTLSKAIIREQKECQLCKAKGKYSPAELTHHVKKLKKHPELAYSRHYIDESGNQKRQLIALCQACHEEQHPDRFQKQKKDRFTNQERW